MKDLCILINGSTRTTIESIKECIENYKRLFANIEHDVYLFTWKTEDGRENQLKDYVDYFYADEECPTQEELDKLGVPFTGQLRAHPEHKICRIGHYAVNHAFRRLFGEIKKINKQYKYALRARNDLYLEIDTTDWIKIIEQDSAAYILPPNLWCIGAGSNDHLGFGLFDLVEKIWATDLESFNNILGGCHNFEMACDEMINRAKATKYIRDPARYIIKRMGRTDHNFDSDWNLK